MESLRFPGGMPPRVVRGLLALATALAGLMNILSALYPAFHWRFLILRDMFTVRIINDSQMWTILLGIVLIILADGLLRRQRRAMQWTLVLLVASAVLHLVKGLDYEEALICLTLGSILFSRREDYIVGSWPITRMRTVTTVVTFGLMFYAYDLLGFRILARWITPKPSLEGALLEPLRLVTDTPVYHYHGYQAHWFGTSLILVGGVALLYSAVMVLRPLIPIHRSSEAERARARGIIEKYGCDSLSYFALREDRAYFFHTEGEAFLSYKIWRNVALVGGDPVGSSVLIADLLRQFRDFCDGNCLTPCFLGVDDRYLATYRSMGLRVLKIGEESLIRLPSFEVAGLKRKVRRAERHCLDLGIVAEMYQSSALPEHDRAQAAEISKRWVRAKGGAERGFSMTLGRIPKSDDGDTRILIARRDDEIVGFLSFVPVFGSNGWSLDMMRRQLDSPNGLTEFMVLQASQILKAEGAEFMSLNFASLSSTEDYVAEPKALRSLRRFLFHNLSSVYQLKSLYQFNAKFEPEWSSRYLVYADILRAPKMFMAVVQSEDPIKLSTVAAVFRR